jgi:Cupredoxin-like domain/Iron permease FTR1 family
MAYRHVLCLALLAGAIVPALADEQPLFDITIEDHRYEPSELKVPAGKPFVLRIKNSAEEFESSRLNIEKVIAAAPKAGSAFARSIPVGTNSSANTRRHGARRAHRRVGGDMLATLIIVFREVIEAGLVIGIVLATARGVHGRVAWVGVGVLAGVAGACLVAAFAGAIGEAFAGSGQELFNAAVLSVAVLMLGWHNVWMARHGRAIAAEAKAVGDAVASGVRHWRRCRWSSA